MKKVKNVSAMPNYELYITFENGEVKYFSVKPYLDKGIFTELKNPEYFKSVKVFLDSVCWPNGQDFDPDHLYNEGSNQSLNQRV